MVKYYNGEMFVIPKEFEEEVRADEREKCKCPYWNEEHRECDTSFEEDIRADEREEIKKECEYLLNCGMGKKKSLEHLIKICNSNLKEQKNDSRRILET